jgi:hypothetical protein
VDYVLDKSYCGEEVFSEECAMSESKSLWKRFVDYWSVCPFCFAGSLPAMVLWLFVVPLLLIVLCAVLMSFVWKEIPVVFLYVWGLIR